MKFTKQITYRGHRWDEIAQDYDLSDSSGVRYLILTRPVSRAAFERDSTFVDAISVKMTELLADPKVSDEVISFCDHLTTHRLRRQVFVSTEDLQALCNVTINSDLRRELDKRNAEGPALTPESFDAVIAKNQQRSKENEGKPYPDFTKLASECVAACSNRINEDYNNQETGNWLVWIYDQSDNEVDRNWIIKDRTEDEARREAENDSRISDADDWTLTRINKLDAETIAS